MEQDYDMAFVGAGISTAYTLWHYLTRLAAHPPPKPVRIIVFEKSGEFWTGAPYGQLSGCSALLISPLKEFIPQETERADFKAWLNQNHHGLLHKSGEPQGQLSARWQRENARAISTGDWDDLYLPRHLFGRYLGERLTNLLQDAAQQGLIEFQLSTSDVADIGRSGDFYRLVSGSGENAPILAQKVILAIGSPPYQDINPYPSDDTGQDACFIDDMYAPSLDTNIQRICECLDQSADSQVLIIGSNASALETLYSLANSRKAMSLISKIIMLSPDAAFPHRINRLVAPTHHRLTHLDALAETSPLVSRDILVAVEKDVADAAAEGLNIADLYHDISQRIIAALGRLDRREQERFVATDGVEIGKLQRRAGPEYLDVAQGLIAQGKLEMHKGRFVKYLSREEGGPGCSYLEGRTGGAKILAAPLAAVISCAGFQDITKSSSTLLQNLIRRGVCTANESKRGLAINASYEASPGCYVMGPLVAGNIIGTFKVWHAESCTRIIHMSQQLAEILDREWGPAPPRAKPIADNRDPVKVASLTGSMPRQQAVKARW